MLSPLLFNIIFAAVLAVVLQRFSEETVILAELVHLIEPPTSLEPQPAMNYVRRAVWGMLYADDACIVWRSPQGFVKMMEEDKDHVHASTAYTGDDGTSRSGRANLQTGAILHLPRGRRDRNPGHVR